MVRYIQLLVLFSQFLVNGKFDSGEYKVIGVGQGGKLADALVYSHHFRCPIQNNAPIIYANVTITFSYTSIEDIHVTSKIVTKSDISGTGVYDDLPIVSNAKNFQSFTFVINDPYFWPEKIYFIASVAENTAGEAYGGFTLHSSVLDADCQYEGLDNIPI